MKAIIQRVSKASVLVDEEPIASINHGFLILLGVADGDNSEDIEWLASKISKLRIFNDSSGLMNLSLMDLTSAEVIVISQFTLHASCQKGNRPSFIQAAEPTAANLLYKGFISQLHTLTNRHIQQGKFGADMKVSLTNDGPVTIILDTKNKS